eukprot:c5640_g2_i1.p1 GENE.c5640_g2_i1~~c5640_g2_i1.p1  ORF type:complete len:356 (+),score=59.24 c5640_g2_i1:81-1070(+)
MAHVMQAGYPHSHVLIVGDLSYADSEGDPNEKNCTQKRWDSWGQKIQSLAASRPLMVLPGNHEVEWIDGMGSQQPFMAFDFRFRLPYPGQHQASDRFYSFNTPWAHVIMLNSFDGVNFQGPFGASSRQYQWLLADLKSIDRQVTPWVIACLHAPWYNSNTNHHNEPEQVDMRSAMEDLIHEYAVDVMFAGHVHAYERTFPMYQNRSVEGGTTYINVGDGGNREGHATGYYEQPEWSAFRNDSSYGHGLLNIYNASHAVWTWHRIEDQEPVVSDSVWFVHNSYVQGSPAQKGVTAVDEFGQIVSQFDGRARFHNWPPSRSASPRLSREKL